MPKFKDLTGKRFGRLVALHTDGKPDKSGSYRWRCRCDCGKEKTLRGSALSNGAIQSCTCLMRETSAVIGRTAIHGHCRNGLLSGTYISWRGMIQRCTDLNYRGTGYLSYRGVTVCKRWLDSFENFIADVGERPTGTSIGRLCDMGNYEVGNAFWQTQSEQNLAKRNHTALMKWAGGTA